MATIVYDQIKLHRMPLEYHFAIQTENATLNLIDKGAALGGINHTNKSVLHMKITYTLSGKNKEYSEDILLQDKIKPSKILT
ncbi:hypothetical protein [Paenibacillus monticola]|uniref:Uncharacterized protein n=1 Tax=Paenibacillus monticola TaxID=2666075 RepID=A0A7X2L1M9_9BACL|nr:hypothetical protein [Paenibacillus monticola]MRN53290.1 hypothetical protein [Paenibacillus monticola]